MTLDFMPGSSLLTHMDLRSDHCISKAQYIRQFEKWAFKKNSSKDQWEGIAVEVRKRKYHGKDSEIFVKNKRIPDKKLRKEISRYAPADRHEDSGKKP